MTPIDVLIFVLGAGLGLCVGWMLGSIAGHRMARAERNPVRVTRTQSVFLPDEPDCVMPPAPPETDWLEDDDDDFERRTGLREPERTYGVPWSSGPNSRAYQGY